MRRADIVQWLRQEAATCEDMTRIQIRHGTKRDAAAFNKKRAMLTAAADEIERAWLDAAAKQATAEIMEYYAPPEPSKKMAEAVASFVAMGWTEDEARKIVEGMLCKLPTKGSA